MPDEEVSTRVAGEIRCVLVANRGEIALRVMHTCRRLGLRTVAVFTELDSAAPHVLAADEARSVPGYLDVDAVVASALAAGADAVHPGYGFLSERAAFARAVTETGLTFVGPTAEVMDAMGRKDAARAIAEAAGVPVVPAHDLDSDDPASFGYPVLVKAAAGGGGKGMRVVRSADELPEAVSAARREAMAAFGDDTMLVERYVERGRHLEVQVLGDEHGTVLHVGERDCSTQRRHQKVVEEAPAPTLDEDTRRRLLEAAVALAREVGYTGAGTVEFLLDADTAEFFFLEMNTRLQVEHPVTELTHPVGPAPLDLVEQQLHVAAGRPLTLTQDDVATAHGHAIEVRVYAEDPFAGFLPQAGTASLVRWPADARVDAALESGQVVSTAYDPMLGKVVVHGPDRETARRGLVAALDRTAVLGLTTNTGFLRALVASDAFADATIHTAWLDSAEGAGALVAPDDALARVVAAWTEVSVLLLTSGDAHPFSPDGWRLAGPPAPSLVELASADRSERWTARVDRAAGRVDEHEVREFGAADHEVTLSVDGRRVRAVVDVAPHGVEVVIEGHRHVFTRPDVFADRGPAAGDGTLVAPMPGTVLDVRVGAGATVAEGQVLGVLEAMKMELNLIAPFAGTVTVADAEEGHQVALGHVLFVVEPHAEGTTSAEDRP